MFFKHQNIKRKVHPMTINVAITHVQPRLSDEAARSLNKVKGTFTLLNDTFQSWSKPNKLQGQKLKFLEFLPSTIFCLLYEFCLYLKEK